MRLLLLLSALLASLTGMVTGGPAYARGGEAAAVAAVAAETATPARRTHRAAVVPARTSSTSHVAPARLLPDSPKQDERRLE